MDNLIRRNKEKAVVEDAAEIIRQREIRYRAELERMAVDQTARIVGLDDRDRRTLESIREEIADVKVTIQDVGGAPATAPAPAYAWELSFLSPAGGAQFQIGSDFQDTYAVGLRVAWRLRSALGPSEAAEAVLQAGRLYLDFGDGTESDLALMSLDGQDTFADGAYSGEVDFGLHTYAPGAYTVAASGGGPLGGVANAAISFAVLDYVAPAQFAYWTWDGASCAAHTGPAIPAGSYGSLAACQAAHPPPVAFWVWDGESCQLQTAPAAPAGAYPTLLACQQAHPPPAALGWGIVGALCLLVPGGQYASFDACMAALNPPPPAEQFPPGSFSLVFHDPVPGFGQRLGGVYQGASAIGLTPSARLDLRSLTDGLPEITSWLDTWWARWDLGPYAGTKESKLSSYAHSDSLGGWLPPWYKFVVSPGAVILKLGPNTIRLTIRRGLADAAIIGDFGWSFTLE